MSDSQRPFGLRSAIALVVANMIGAGVFTTSGFSYGDLGSRRFVLIAWLLGGLIALCGAIGYGQLARRIQLSGGEYTFLSRNVHPAVGFVAGWVSLLAGFTGALAFAALTFEAYALPEAFRPDWLPENSLALGVLVLFGVLHGLRVRAGVRVQDLIVALKVTALVAVLAIAVLRWPDTGVRPDPDLDASFDVVGMARALVWISLAYSGFNAAVYVAGEVREPERNVPRSLWIGTSIVIALYLSLNAVFLFAPDPAAIRGRPDVAIPAAEAIGGEGLATALRGVIALAMLSSVSSLIVAGPRVYAQMARDGVMPKRFSFGNAASPSAVFAQAILGAAVVLVAGLEDLLDYLGLTLSLCAAATVASVLRPRRWSSLIHGPILPALYVIATLTLGLLAADWKRGPFLSVALTFGTGIGVYGFLRPGRG